MKISSRYLTVFPVIALLLSSLACSFTVNMTEAKIGAPQTFTISETVSGDYPTAKISIEMGAGELDIQGGSEKLVEGEVQYNIPEWKPEIIRDGSNLLIRQGRKENLRIPTKDVVNRWQLRLGSTPIDLDIAAGAYRGTLNLSGVALTRLNVQDGASQAEVRFDQPNPVQMESLRYRTGASEVSLIGLGNASPAFLNFEGGTGSYTLDFSGRLQQDLDASISAGVSSLKIIIPAGTPARVVITGGLNNVQPSGTWRISNNVYETEGEGPKININLNMGVGNLELISQ
ncbi:MAG: toast rack family protein [Chloroflexota bacterium]|nr:MAG: lipoprotein [Bellilinea sp.]